MLESLEHTFPWKDDGETVQPEDRIPLLEWFATRHGDFENQPALKQRLASLALFPAGGGYRPLIQLSLPGDFEDRLGVAEVIDIARVRALIPFLESLGAKTLSLPEYVKRHVPRALEGGKLSVSLRRDLVTLLAERMGELQDHNDCRRVLTEAPIVSVSTEHSCGHAMPISRHRCYGLCQPPLLIRDRRARPRDRTSGVVRVARRSGRASFQRPENDGCDRGEFSAYR